MSLALAIPILMALFALFRPEQNGVVRALLVVVIAALLVWVRVRPAEDARVARVAALLAVLALAFDVAVAGVSIVHSARTDEIYLDQGENTRAAALLIARGENPYGARAFIDTELYRTSVPHPDMKRAERARRELEPLPAPDHRFGHKYGPLNALAALPFVVAFGAAGIPLLNLLYFLAFVACVAALVPRAARPLVVFAVAADIVAVAVFLRNSAQDIGCLALCAGALLVARSRPRPAAPGPEALFAGGKAPPRGRGAASSVLERPYLAAILVGAAIAMKVVPGALFVVLLLRRPRALALALGVALAIHLPFLVADPDGLVFNLFGWSLVRPPDRTSWIYFAPQPLVLAGRGLLALAALALVVHMARRGPSPRALALLTAAVLLAGSSLHDNYVPWLAWLVYFSSTAASASIGSGGGATPARTRASGSSIMSTLT